MNDQLLFEKIESYLLEKMTPQEKEAFELSIKDNSEIAALVNEQKEHHKILELMLEEDLKTQMAKWDNIESIDSFQKISSYSIRDFILLGGFIFLLFFSGYYFLKSNKTEENKSKKTNDFEIEKVTPEEGIKTEKPIKEFNKKKRNFAQTKEAPTEKKKGQPRENKKTPNSKITYLAIAEKFDKGIGLSEYVERSSEGINPVIKDALDSIHHNNLAAGVQLLESELRKTPKDLEIIYYLGLAKYTQKNYTSAIPFLKVIHRNKDFQYSEDVSWLLALTYLYVEKPRASKGVLNKILEIEGHSYFVEAGELLEEINDFQ